MCYHYTKPHRCGHYIPFSVETQANESILKVLLVDLPTNLRYNTFMAIQTKQPAKWRETADPFSFDFNNFTLVEVLGYPHAGNDVFFVKGIFDEKEVYAFIKSKRHVDANLENEVFIINSLPLSNVPKVLDYDGKDFSFCVLSAMDGQRLSVLVGDNADNRSLDYMFEYGKALASLHKSKIDGLKEVKWRRFFDIPSDEFLAEYGLDFVKDYLVKNKPSKINQCFVHGDFHYANLLWENGKISGILDFELAGLGNKEFDVAWTVIRRPGQTFMKTQQEIDLFLEGYCSANTIDESLVKYYMVQVYCHFYAVGKNNEEYCAYIKDTLKTMIEE